MASSSLKAEHDQRIGKFIPLNQTILGVKPLVTSRFDPKDSIFDTESSSSGSIDVVPTLARCKNRLPNGPISIGVESIPVVTLLESLVVEAVTVTLLLHY